MNTSKEFISQVVDEIERREFIQRLRSNLAWSAYWIEMNVKERDIVQSKLDNLQKRLSWWNRWFISNRIKRCEQELERLNNNISLAKETLDIRLKNYEWLKNYERKGTTNL